MSKASLLTFLLLLCAVILKAQPKGYDIQYKENTIKINRTFWSPFWKNKLKHSIYKERYYVFFQFFELPDENRKELLDNKGIRILYYLHNKTYLVSVPIESMNKYLRVLKLRAIRPLPTEAKLSPELSSGKFPARIVRDGDMIEINLEFYPDLDSDDLKRELKLNGIRHVYLLKSYNKFRIRIPSKYLWDVARLPWVMWIEPIEPPNVKKSTQ